ncbi:hypothetical protein ACKKBG_A28405 [Auxenochlorella protothecoides x Auxenochlorella symbiontica]
MHQDAFPECPSSYPGMERHESPAADFHDIAMAAKDMGTPQRVDLLAPWHAAHPSPSHWSMGSHGLDSVAHLPVITPPIVQRMPPGPSDSVTVDGPAPKRVRLMHAPSAHDSHSSGDEDGDEAVSCLRPFPPLYEEGLEDELAARILGPSKRAATPYPSQDQSSSPSWCQEDPMADWDTEEDEADYVQGRDSYIHEPLPGPLDFEE